MKNRHLLWLTMTFAGMGCLAAVVAAGLVLLKAAGKSSAKDGGVIRSDLDNVIAECGRLTEVSRELNEDLKNMVRKLESLQSRLAEQPSQGSSGNLPPTPSTVLKSPPGQPPPTLGKLPPPASSTDAVAQPTRSSP